MAKNAAKKAAQQKAKKQKKVLIGLGLVLAATLVYAVMTLSHLGGSPQSAGTPAATATTPDGTAPTGSPVSAVIPGVAAASADSLHSFTAFTRKDPFNDGGTSAAKAPPDSSNGGKPCGCGSGSKQPPVPLTGAVISLNGHKLALSLGAKFGHAPGLSGVWLFRLVKVTQHTALIAVVGTHQQFTLHVRSPLTLQQDGGWTYRLILEPPGSAAPMTVQPNNPTP